MWCQRGLLGDLCRGANGRAAVQEEGCATIAGRNIGSGISSRYALAEEVFNGVIIPRTYAIPFVVGA